MRILAGDIGGTHARLLFTDDAPGSGCRHVTSYRCADYQGLLPIIDAFLSTHAIAAPFDAVALAVAGPVIEGRVSITNLPWEITVPALQRHLATGPVYLINDLAAVACALPGLPAETLLLLPGAGAKPPASLSRAVVVGVGTGLGAAQLFCRRGHCEALSSEAGHAGFAPETAEQERLLGWLRKEQAHVSVEMLLSGPGIHRLYRFFRDEQGQESPQLDALIRHSRDPAAVIVQQALSGNDALCTRSMECFVEMLGSAVGNIALHCFPLDALYLVGGVAQAILPLLRQARFRRALARKGPMQTHLERLPLALVTSDSAGLEGALAHAREQCRQERGNP